MLIWAFEALHHLTHVHFSIFSHYSLPIVFLHHQWGLLCPSLKYALDSSAATVLFILFPLSLPFFHLSKLYSTLRSSSLWGLFWQPLAQNALPLHWILIACPVWTTNLALNPFWLTLSLIFSWARGLTPHPNGKSLAGFRLSESLLALSTEYCK